LINLMKLQMAFLLELQKWVKSKLVDIIAYEDVESGAMKTHKDTDNFLVTATNHKNTHRNWTK
jgi:hypothetical protein